MHFEEEFRLPKECAALLSKINAMELPPIRLMEVCGTHTMAIAKSGLRFGLNKSVKLISGPGCPVCVTPAGAMDEVLRISGEKDVIVTSYGDLIRVPGSQPGDNLARRRALGADVRVVYSPMDAVEIAAQNLSKKVVFLGVGFETTAPGTAIAVMEAESRGIDNFFLISMLKRTEPALRALIAGDDFRVDGFICPGHVATIVGAEAFRFLPKEFGLGAVVTGFETSDVLTGIYKLICQVRDGAPRLENEYTRAVSPEGNTAAMSILNSVFSPCDDVWRGLGFIENSGMALRNRYERYDGARYFGFAPTDKEDTTACSCGDIICGRKNPEECRLFGKACTPDRPVGPCMVSSEGACAAAYHYQRVM